MKNNISLKIIGRFFYCITQQNFSHTVEKNTLSQYYKIISNAKDIGKKNQLLSAYAMCAWFIAMNRSNNLSPEKTVRFL